MKQEQGNSIRCKAKSSPKETDEDKRNKARKDYSGYEFKERPESELIIDLACANNKFFKDQNSIVYALVKIKNHYESIPLDSDRFKSYLMRIYYDEYFHKIAHKESINSAIQYLQSIAEFDSPIIPLHIRVAWSEDKKSIYYDLTDENWYCIRIDRNGVNLEMDLNFPLFKRYNQTVQPIPEKMYDPNVFDKFISLTNVKESDDILLTKVWIVSTFIPDFPHTILNVHGEQGAAKTTFEKLVKLLVDPDRPDNLLSVSHEKMEFIQQLAHRHVAFYDNLKYIPAWLPEEICKAVTGGGTSVRKLWTDEGDIIFDYKRCLGFNGINMVMNEPDVLRRSIIIKLLTIQPENVVSEVKIFSILEEIKPHLLDYIFDIVSKAMSIKDSLEIEKLPTMADFAIWGEAISRAMGYEEMEFIDAYRRNIEKQNQHVIDTHPLARTIKLLSDELNELQNKVKQNFHYNEESRVWSTSMQEFHEELGRIAINEGIDTRDSKVWAHSPRSLSNRLNIVSTNLRSYGIDIVIRRSTNKEDVENGYKKGVSIVEIRPVGNSILDYNQNSEDGEDGEAVHALKNQNEIEGIEVEKYTDKSLTALTTLTTGKKNYSLMLIYKGSAFLNHLQHGLRTCPNCGETGQVFYMRLHHCED